MLFLVFGLFLLPGIFYAQNSLLDSLLEVNENAPSDTNKVILLTDIAWELKFEEPESARQYLAQALQLAQQLNFTKGKGTAYNIMGVVEDIHGNSKAAIEYFQKALEIRQALGDRKGVASLFNNIGNLRENQGDYLAALKNYQESLRIREEMGDTQRATKAYYNIAILHEGMGNYLEALDYIFLYLEGIEKSGDEEATANAWNIVGNIKTELDRLDEALVAYQKALALHRKLGNKWEESSVLNNIANLKDSQAEDLMDDGDLSPATQQLFDEAVALHQQSLAIRLALKDSSGMAEIYNNIGYVLKNVGSFHKKSGNKNQAEATWQAAENSLLKSLAFRQLSDDKVGTMEVYNGLSDVRRRQKKYAEALRFAKKYYAIAKDIGDQKFQQNGLKDLARIYYKLGEYKKAYKARKKYDELRYARFNERRNKDEARREALYSDRKKQYEIERQEQEIKLQEAELEQSKTVRNSLIGGALLLLLLALAMLNRNKVIRSEKQRSDELLLNILPAQTADELKKYGKATARQHEQVTVLFTDFKSFTNIAENTAPAVLVEELDRCFRAFDGIISKYKIEKIKTIGDAYLCAAGLPEPSPSHAEDCVSAALEMQAFMERFREEQKQKKGNEYYCRIGIHSGPVVAGVVGKKKFAYDIWGDTVNIAARMEQSGEVNKINISQAVFERVKDKFRCTHRGKVTAKNKGSMDMYFVEKEVFT